MNKALATHSAAFTKFGGLSGWTWEAQRVFATALQRSWAASPPVAAFDCDQTTVRGDSGWAVYNAHVDDLAFAWSDALFAHIGDAYRAGDIRDCVTALRPLAPPERRAHALFPTYRRLMLGANYDRYAREGGQASCPWLVQSYQGLAVDAVQATTRAALFHELHRPLATEVVSGANVGLPDLTLHHGIRLFPPAAALMSLLTVAGFQIAVVSGSHRMTVGALMAMLHLPVDYVFGMDTIVDGDRFTEQLRHPLPWQDGKAAIVRDTFGVPPMLAFGDSSGDLPLLQSATDGAVLIDHDRLPLQRHAEAHGWVIQPTAQWKAQSEAGGRLFGAST